MGTRRESASGLSRLVGSLGRVVREIFRRWDERVLGGLTLRMGEGPPIPIIPSEMEWRPQEWSFVWSCRIIRAEVVSEFRIHRGEGCLAWVRPRVPLYLLPGDELTVRVPGVIHPFGSYTAFPERCELELPDRPADAVRLACLGCGREFPVIELWLSKRFEGKAYCDACFYGRFGPRRRRCARNGSDD